MVCKGVFTKSFMLACCIVVSYQNPVLPINHELKERYGDALEAVFGIGIRLQVLLADPNISKAQNFVVSPISAALLLSQLMLGADKHFGAELYDLLSLPKSNDDHYSTLRVNKKHGRRSYKVSYAKFHRQMSTLYEDLTEGKFSQSFKLNCANALFTNSDLTLRKAFNHNLEIYETEVRPLNFSTDPLESQRLINKWVAAQTNGTIKTLLPTPLPVSTSAVFANTVYFLGDWETPFDHVTTIKGYFQLTKETKVEVTYMNGNFESIPYVESDKLGCRMIALPYKNKEMSMYILFPNENNGEEYDIRKFSKNLKVKDTLELIEQAKPQQVFVQMPKLKLFNSLSVLKPLQKYRLYRKQLFSDDEIYNRSASGLDVLDARIYTFSSFNTTETSEILLTWAAENENLKITNVLQQVTLTVDEKGSEASAASTSILNYIGGTQQFKLNRPFVFFIRHELTLATLFWGTIVNPSENLSM